MAIKASLLVLSYQITLSYQAIKKSVIVTKENIEDVLATIKKILLRQIEQGDPIVMELKL